MRITVHIQNLKYDACTKTILNRLSKVTNISEVEVNNDEFTVAFNYHTHHDFENAKHVLSRIGYPIVGAENKLITSAQ